METLTLLERPGVKWLVVADVEHDFAVLDHDGGLVPVVVGQAEVVPLHGQDAQGLDEVVVLDAHPRTLGCHGED